MKFVFIEYWMYDFFFFCLDGKKILFYFILGK